MKHQGRAPGRPKGTIKYPRDILVLQYAATFSAMGSKASKQSLLKAGLKQIYDNYSAKDLRRVEKKWKEEEFQLTTQQQEKWTDEGKAIMHELYDDALIEDPARFISMLNLQSSTEGRALLSTLFDEDGPVHPLLVELRELQQMEKQPREVLTQVSVANVKSDDRRLREILDIWMIENVPLTAARITALAQRCFEIAGEYKKAQNIEREEKDA